MMRNDSPFTCAQYYPSELLSRFLVWSTGNAWIAGYGNVGYAAARMRFART